MLQETRWKLTEFNSIRDSVGSMSFLLFRRQWFKWYQIYVIKPFDFNVEIDKIIYPLKGLKCF